MAQPLSPISRPAPTRWRRLLEAGFWVGLIALNSTLNTATVAMDAQRLDLGLAPWEPAVLEWSSALAWLALVPAIAWFTRRYPLHLDTWHRQLPRHVLFSAAVSMAHVAAMVLLRRAAYAAQGTGYELGTPWVALPYEYLKDLRTYALVVATLEVYRFILRRRQGEARLLDRPDEGEPLEPVERPERFLVRKLNRDFLVAAADIEWLQAAGNYVNLRVRGHDYPLRSTIGGITARLDPDRFARVHRSFVVNLDHVASIEPLDTGDARVHLKDGSVVPCSRRHRDALRARIGS